MRRTVKSQIAAFNAGKAGAEDPTAGVISERAWLYSGDAQGRTFGAATDAHIKVHRDGYTTAHVGGCAAEVAEAPEDALIRAAGLDAREAEIVRLRSKGESTDTIATALGISVRGAQRKIAAIRVKAEGYAATVRGMGSE